MKKINPMSIIIFIYIWSLIFLSLIFSTFKEELFIDGDEIKNVCDAIRVFVVDDYRMAMATSIILAIIPALIYMIKTKFRNFSITLSVFLFFFIWIYSFIFKFKDCLWF